MDVSAVGDGLVVESQVTLPTMTPTTAPISNKGAITR